MAPQFTLYSHKGGPNGWKVAYILEELELTYEQVFLDFQSGEHKKPAYTAINPNGRIPALIDHKNKDFTIWESGAIIQYLLAEYDPTHKLSFADKESTYKLAQWLFFQASGQGPYFGQLAWFKRFHAEQLPSAIERYQNEVRRVFGVLEGVLSKSDYLVGNKISAADISFLPWNTGIGKAFDPPLEFEKDFPNVGKWHERILSLPSVVRVNKERFA